MHALLSLANTESHNFTAEVLMREAADAWDVNRAALATTRWMQAQGFPDGAAGTGWQWTVTGKPLTSRSLSVLLWRMAQHPLAAYYQASWRLPGKGARCATTSAVHPFRDGSGETGTLTGVHRLGILEPLMDPAT